MLSQIRGTLISIATSRIVQICVGICISLLAIYLVSRQAYLTKAISVIEKASPLALLAGLMSVLVNTVAKVARWQLLLGAGWQQIPFTRLLTSLLGSQLLNALLPVRLGDISRAYDIGGLGLGRSFVLGGVVIEKIIDMACLAILLLLLILWLPVPAWMSRSAYASLAAGIVVVLLMLMLVNRLDWVTHQFVRVTNLFPDRIRELVAPRLRAGILSITVIKERGVQLRVSLLSATIWGSALLTNHLVLLAFSIQLPIAAACLVLLSLMVGVSVPNVAGGLGIFEYLCIVSLGVFGVDPDTALSYGLVLHVLVLLPMILAGPAFLVGQRRSRRESLV